MRILYIHSTLVPPPVDQSMDRFYLLSRHLEGDVLQPIWTSNPEAIEKTFGPGSYPAYQSGRFRYHWILERPKGIRRTVSTFWFCIRTGLRAYRERPYDCIVTYSHMTTALFGVVLKLLTGAKLIVEIVTCPELAYVTARPKPTLRDRLMRAYSDLCLHVSLLAADRAHCLYPTQLDSYPLLKRVPRSVFHEFVPVAAIGTGSRSAEPFILLVGAPWYLKGADLLITAFRKLAPDFPDVRLKIVGHYPDADKLRALSCDIPRIEILKALHYRAILDLIAQARVLVLPSRCEGTPRVLTEAMAAGVPVVGSDVGGIPFMIREGKNGFVCPAGDSAALEQRLRQLLSDEVLCRRMGDEGWEISRSLWNEQVYAEQFARMVEDTLKPLE